ncbi:alpha-1,3-arabinosyltransferase XAT3-like isoform X2 [Panicum virgatum]|uniref:alpha-1,3-arabinosyltransferase XAT3-like isoform X2 n=1 Tax=Panicum virgatum TaxID=38727 RepID=UPI0019D53EFA|nr:alpha-1,3-arabinosyltransferase XAT3-like isoform X2 [Panicum virgatum]
MKGGGKLQQPLRLESQRFRLLSIVVGCFVICLVFLLSSRPDATAFDTVSPRASLEGARRRPAAVKTLRTSSTAGVGGDVHVDIRPQQQQGGSLRQSVEQSAGDKTATEWVRDTVIVEERSDAEASEAAAEPEEAERDGDGNAAAAASNPDDQPAPGAETEEVRDAAATATAQPAAETTATAPDRPEGKPRAAGGGQSKLQEQPARQPQEERHEPARRGNGTAKATPDQTLSTGSSGGDHQQPLCDFSDFRSDICDMAGDIRMDANASAFVVVDPAASGADGGQWHRVRPYPRKGDETCMGRITEVTVRSAGGAAPRCTREHAAPAVVFSIGGYTGNIFHDFSDVLVPLYNTARRYGGDVQLVMADVSSWWLVKYDKLLRALSRHAPQDLARAGAAGEVHCFRRAVVSLRAHKELIIERARSADGLATPDFTRFVRRALSLPRDAPTRLGDGTGRKPRLLVISRHRTRLLLNLDAVVRAAEEVGFEAVVNESDVGNDIAQVGALVNSCDALVGVHGAGLTNMMFLPPGATLVQIVPWGGLQWMARADYGDPAEAMGLRYIQYEVAVGESTLKDKFPPGHKIFTDPTSLHKKGFMFIRQTLMDGQDIAVDVGRFREVLLQVLNNLSQ